MLVQGEGSEMKKGYFSKLPKEKLQKVVLICILTLIAVVGVVQFYLLKNWSALTETQASVVKLQDQIRQADRKARSVAQDVANRAEMKTFVEAQWATMITGDPFAWVVREISLLAEQHPVHVGGLHPGSKAESDGRSRSPIYKTRIEFSGTYDQIGVFVRDLENRFPTSEIQSLSISGNADDKGEHTGMLDIGLRIQPPEPSKKAEAKRKT
jgi:Tfp pilus assembly protein PilO